MEWVATEMKRIKLGLMSDSPDANSGLARITRDLATRLYKSSLPIEVATLGFSGTGSRDLPWTQYNLGTFTNSADIPRLMASWLDFTKGERGLLFTIYDIPRLEAFRFPEHYPPQWGAFLAQQKSPFFLAGYFPIDGHAPRLMNAQMAEVLRAFDSVGSYGPYGDQILRGTLGGMEGPKPSHIWSAPHGIDPQIWKPAGSAGRARLRRVIPSELKDEKGNPLPRTLEVGPQDKLLGVVATNQPRKDWGAAFQLMSKLDPEWKFWFHLDKLQGYWSIPDLVDQYGLNERAFVTGGLPDEVLAELYSACDLTLAIGSEGFGYPIAESLSCGTPVLHTNYAGGADLLPEEMLVGPLTLSPVGPYCIQRPVMDVDEWARRIRIGVGEGFDSREWARERYDWATLWPRTWKPIFEGLLEEFHKTGGEK